jgi:predicted dehydrogenase
MNAGPRAALIGAGEIAPFHVAALRAAGFSVDHIAASPDSSRAATFAQANKIPHYWPDPVALIESDTWDAIVLASSTESIPRLLESVVKSSRPCLVEKPVAFNVDDILKFTAQSDLVRVAYNRRFYATAARAKHFADTRECLFRLELPDTTRDVADSFDGLRSVWENSVHGLDLLSFVVGPYQIESRLDVHNPRARVATVTTEHGHVGTIVLNWNCPANFALVLDAAPQRFEMRPFEIGALYEGMEIKEPTSEVPVRRYVPKLVDQIDSFPGPDGLKPGFGEQAVSLMRRVTTGIWDERSATLADAAIAIDSARLLTLTTS